MKHVVIGAAGQLGHALVAALGAGGGEVIALTRADLDVCDAGQVARVLAALAPQRVLNTAAYHQVDACETRAAEAFAVNATALRTLALACRDLGATLVHFSTDFVFDGAQRHPYRETDPPNPLSVYAVSKLAGEFLAGAYCPRHLVVRTCGLYGVGGSRSRGGNFVETMLRLAAAGEPIRVVADQIVSPTYTRDLAAAVVDLLALEDTRAPADYYGVYHVTNGGHCSWYDFAAAILAEAGVRANLAPIGTAERPAPARRPPYSALAHVRLRSLGLPEPRPWREALRAYLAERGGGLDRA